MVQLRSAVVFSVLLACTACDRSSPDADKTAAADVNALAKDYLVLELAMGEHDAGHVDAYFGPTEIQAEAEASGLTLEAIASGASQLASRLGSLDTKDDAELTQRIDGLLARLQALEMRVAINLETRTAFDEEARRLFGTTAPHKTAAEFDAVLQRIDALLPGESALSARVDEFLNGFNVPPEKLAAVFDAAIAECRRRTAEFIDMPAGESFTVEYVKDQPWSGYNWYQGNATSLIQINTDFPSRISSAVNLGCHEGYPGHHLYNTLLEKNLVDGKGWLEFSLYPLFSPQSFIAEGSGNYGVKLAFSDAERIRFEKEVLFPLAGLDPFTADKYYQLLDLQAELSFARNTIARQYLDGEASREEALAWSMKYDLVSEERAQQTLDFIDTYRSYVINYNYGMQIVGGYIERDTASAAERWQKFEAMLSTSMLPADLR